MVGQRGRVGTGSLGIVSSSRALIVGVRHWPRLENCCHAQDDDDDDDDATTS